MDRPLFLTQTFSVNDAKKCACLITGYRGKIASYKGVIKILNERGYSVVAYEHTPEVLTKGDPELLLSLVKQICADFGKRASGFQEVICTGASIGAGLCFAVQHQFPHVKFGVYAGAGVSPPETIYEAPLFYFVSKKFAKHGYHKADLKEAWSEVDISPTKNLTQAPFIMALGKKDRIVKYDKALASLHAWQGRGQNIQIVTKERLGHVGLIRWYKNNFNELLDRAEKLTT